MESALSAGAGAPGLKLIETLCWDGQRLVRLPLHLARLAASAQALGWGCDLAVVEAALKAAVPVAAARIRLTLDSAEISWFASARSASRSIPAAESRTLRARAAFRTKRIRGSSQIMRIMRIRIAAVPTPSPTASCDTATCWLWPASCSARPALLAPSKGTLIPPPISGIPPRVVPASTIVSLNPEPAVSICTPKVDRFATSWNTVAPSQALAATARRATTSATI